MRVLLAVILAGVSATAGAQLYRWTDEKGKVHFGDTPPPTSAREVQKKAAVRGGDAKTAPGTAAEPFVLQQARRDYPITLYSTPGCEACDLARQLLNGRGLPFREVSVTTDQQIAELTNAVGSNSVPAMVVGPTVVKGFEEGAYQRALDAAGYPKPGMLPARAQAEPKSPDTKAAEQKPAAETPPATPKGPYWSPGR